jgi:hypothetical protein
MLIYDCNFFYITGETEVYHNTMAENWNRGAATGDYC